MYKSLFSFCLPSCFLEVQLKKQSVWPKFCAPVSDGRLSAICAALWALGLKWQYMQLALAAVVLPNQLLHLLIAGTGRLPGNSLTISA